MRLQLASPAEHPDLGLLPFGTDLAEWSLPSIHEVSGLHRHVVRLVELGEGHRRRSYVVKELPDHLVLREYRLLRSLDEDDAADRRRRRRRHRTDRRTRRPARHPPPRLLVAVPLAAVGPRPAHPLSRRAPPRCPRRAARAPPPGRVLLGRLLAVEHVVPPRRRSAVGVRHRRRDLGALPVAHRRPTADGPRHRHRERRRRPARPADRRAPRRGRRPVGGGDEHRGPLRVAVGGVDLPPRSSSSTSCGASRSASSGCTTSASTSPRWT